MAPSHVLPCSASNKGVQSPCARRPSSTSGRPPPSCSMGAQQQRPSPAPQQQQLDPPLLAGANLSHGALQQTPWSIPAMARDPASSLLACCCAVPRRCLLCARRNAQQATRRRFPAAGPASPRSAGSLFYKRSEQHVVDLAQQPRRQFTQPHGFPPRHALVVLDEMAQRAAAMRSRPYCLH
jgi:hypothetical protein